ncbi:MAG TPA: CoA ester lyase [Anaeromyxobacteraceae bacterium]|nr:CoA ester lyase [Anaeromyxobacteraceae bacterium]
MSSARPRRSALYVPGHNARAVEKARSLPADVLIFDLEDAVAPAVKEEARGLVLAELARGGFGHRERVVRVNGATTPWGAGDLEAVARAPVDAVLLPKVEGPREVGDAERRLAALATPPSVALWAMLETPRGVLRAADVAGAGGRLACLVAGTSDLVKDLHARHTPRRLEVLTALSLVVLAARAHGLAALDGVHLDLADDAGFEAACEQGVDLGFDGKTLVHPKTIAPANRLFAPSAEAVAHARRVIEAHAEAVARGIGVVVVDGRLVESLHVLEARRVMELGEAVAALGPTCP